LHKVLQRIAQTETSALFTTSTQGECVSYFQVTKIDFHALKTFMGYRIVVGILKGINGQ